MPHVQQGVLAADGDASFATVFTGPARGGIVDFCAGVAEDIRHEHRQHRRNKLPFRAGDGPRIPCIVSDFSDYINFCRHRDS